VRVYACVNVYVCVGGRERACVCVCVCVYVHVYIYVETGVCV